MLFMMCLAVISGSLFVVRKFLLFPIIDFGGDADLWEARIVNWAATLLVMFIVWAGVRWSTNRYWDKRAVELQRLKDEVKQTIEEHDRECRLQFVIDGQDAEKQWPEVQRLLDARYGIKAHQGEP